MHLPFIFSRLVLHNHCMDTDFVSLCISRVLLVCCSWFKSVLRPSFSRSFNQQQTTPFRTLSYSAISRRSSRQEAAQLLHSPPKLIITAACCMSVMHTGMGGHTGVPAAEVLRLQMSEPRLYQDLGTYETIKPVVQEVLEEYNIKKKPMNLVFFDDALEHLTRIHRILRLRQVRKHFAEYSRAPLPPVRQLTSCSPTPTHPGCMLLSHNTCVGLQGNALLVGVGGSGKQSLAKLAAYLAGCDVFEITLTRGYDEIMFREALKELYTMLGADDKKVSSLMVSIATLLLDAAPTGLMCVRQACSSMSMPPAGHVSLHRCPCCRRGISGASQQHAHLWPGASAV